MQRDPPPTPAAPSDPLPRPVPSDSLTPAQLEFARLLGRILAERWDREHTRARPAIELAD